MNEPKLKRTKKQYDEVFRRNAVALVESSERSLKEIAAELGVTHWKLRDWTRKHGRNQPVPAAGHTRGDAARDGAPASGE